MNLKIYAPEYTDGVKFSPRGSRDSLGVHISRNKEREKNHGSMADMEMDADNRR